MKTIFSTIILLLACYQNISAQQTGGAIDTFIEQKIRESGIVGLGAAIIVDKKVVWTKGYGFADKESGIPFTTNTIMNIGSISKTFTGVCLMKAVEEKKLSLDEDINTYLPFKIVNPNYPHEKITLRNLATHTSSLADRSPYYSDSLYFYGSDSPEPLGEFLRDYFVVGGKHYSKENFLNAKPGTIREYSNIAAGLAGYIVEVRTGKRLNEYSKQHIFKPLQMNNTGWFFSEVDLKKHAKLYNNEDGTLKPIQLYGVTTYPDGSVRTSVAELAKFFIALLNEGEYEGRRILKKETVMEMLRLEFNEANKPENVDPVKLNSGIFWATKFGGTKIGHSGSDPGVKTDMLADLSKETAVILFMNTSLSEKDMKKYVEVYNELFRYANTLKGSK